MIVYIEYVIFDNMLVNLLITVITVCALKKKLKIWRVFVGSALGTAVAAIMPFFMPEGILLILFKLTLSMAIVAIITKYRRFREYLIGIILFYLVSFLFGGIVMAFCAESLNVSNYYYRTDINVGVLALAGLFAVYILRQAVAYTCKANQKLEKLVQVTAVLGDITVKGECYGLIDSGNNSYFMGKPIVFVSRKYALKLNRDVIGKITVNTVTGSNELDVIIIPEIDLCQGKKKFCFREQPAAVTEQDFDYYDVILHSTMEVVYA